MIWLIAIVIILGIGIVVWLITRLFSQMNQQIDSLRQDLNVRLQETGRNLQDTHKIVGERLDGMSGIIGMVHSVIGGVQATLGKMVETDKHISEKLKDISSLQDLLRPPQIRGGIGETLLESIITQVFPQHGDFYQFQYQFKTGDQVDAVIRVGDNLIPIDAKFPLESFQRMNAAQSEQEKKISRTDFINSVKKKINDIAAKYILPDEKTTDFAMMYIPSEPIYLEIIKEEQLWSFAINKKIIPISPNTLYPYILVIWKGIRGVKLEKSIQEAMANLGRLQLDLEKVHEDFRVLGSHLENARSKYNECEKRLDHFSGKFTDIQQAKLTEERKAIDNGGK